MKRPRSSKRSAFTLVEMVLVTVCMLIVVSLLVAALLNALVTSEMTSAAAKAEEMNKAIQAASIDGLTPPTTTVDATHDWLVSHGYIRPPSQ